MRRRQSRLTSYATRDWSKGGKPPFDPELMLKVLVLQKFHGLNDGTTEEQIFDHTCFKSFIALGIGDVIPDTKRSGTSRNASKRMGARAVANPSNPPTSSSKPEVTSPVKAASSTPASPKPRDSVTAASKTSASKRADGPRSLKPTLPWTGTKTATLT